MTFPVNPTIYADFTGASGTNSYIFNGASVPDLTTWLTLNGATFARSSTAYFTNSSGLLTQAANNVLRFDYDPVALTSNGVLLEGSSTNVALQSNTFSNAAWGQFQAGVPAETGVGPDGLTSAWTFTPNTSNNTHQLFQLWTGTAATYTYSVYVKPSGYSKFGLRENQVVNAYATFNLSGAGSLISNASTSGTSITQIANGWYRVSMTFTGQSATLAELFHVMDNGYVSGDPGSYSFVGDGASGVLVFGAQIEQAGFASSYIPTIASSASRSADQFSVPWLNNTGSIFAVTRNIPVGSITASQRIIGINGAVDATLGIGANNQTQVFTGAALINATLGSGTFSSAAVASAVSGNGTTINVVGNAGSAASASSALFSVPVTGLVLGADNNFNNSIFGNLYQFGAWTAILTVAEIQTLTTPGVTITFDLNPTTLTRAGKYFSRKDYAEWLARIVGENEESRLEYEKFVSEAERERNLTSLQRAIRDHENAATEFGAHEVNLFNNVTTTNHIKYSEAKEKLERTRKERDHQYYMDIVNKEWVKYNEAKER